MATPFTTIYESFLARVTDEMYLEMTDGEVTEQLQTILINSLNRFNYPRFDIQDYELGSFDYLGEYNGVDSDYIDSPLYAWIGGKFNDDLTVEEINILSVCMLAEWFIQQIANTNLTRMIYTGSDFKMSSQASHLNRLNTLKESALSDVKRLLDLYDRRIRVGKNYKPRIGKIMTKLDYSPVSKENGNYVSSK